jgi:hypothetical protein
MRRSLPILLAAALVALPAAALAQHGPVPAGPAPAPKPGETRTLQAPAEQAAWMNNPHMKAFYELTKQSFANGPARVDFPTYQEKSFEIFRAFGKSMGGNPEQMVDHLKAIPGQMLQIVASEPHALDTYETFRVAMMGPD